MGVKHFYHWYKNNFSSCIEKKPDQVDMLAIDLNGLFHTCAQRIYKYGNLSNHLLYHSKITLLPKTNLTLYRDICEKIEYLRNSVKPSKKIILCVDGVAGLGKMNQQRQRRFKTGATIKDNFFDPNSFTPGTKLMDHLTKYIDWYIRTMITLNPEWQSLDIIFSNEKVPGEGEHKIMHFLKKYANPNEIVCIYGLDADLMMLGVLLPHDHVMIAREPEHGFIEYVNISKFREELFKMMKWNPDYINLNEPVFDKEIAINDFILLSSLVGNDFLPTIPTITIIDGAIDIILDIYKETCKNYGHLTMHIDNSIMINLESMAQFMKEFSKYEKDMLEKKYNTQQSFFPDPLVLKHMKLENEFHVIDFDKYKLDYYNAKFNNANINDIILEYIHGMIWVLNYYKFGIPDWTWFYTHLYGPFIIDFYDVLKHHYKPPLFNLQTPIPPFLQLLMVLPENSKDLVPEPFQHLMNSKSTLGKYFPDSFEIDLTGKRKEWEGVVILPTMSLVDFRQQYDKLEYKIPFIDRKRNIIGKNFIYTFDCSKNDIFSSYYGNIPECPVSVSILYF